ncbi:hypothetical protein PVK74_24830 [Micromonospora chalcea]|uniref:hypothetical protein n=1 Tax=Micromonospora chalcea TaxID=1874 RepID=UPI002378D253|nr:hypothetical protein [Micromonospora chalcea]WDP99053.1 hypothetical protein PVK74_24830 [Micromonospora chalcea]
MTEPAPFVELRMKGQRFDHPGMPVEALSELVAYRELLVEVAKALFLRNNPGRQRVPKGFVERLRLRLRRVDEGSALPVLERLDTDAEGFFPREDEFVVARRLIEAAISSVASEDTLPSDFPEDVVGYFNRFGRSLLPGDSIELREPGHERGAVYTANVRRRLLLSRSSTYRVNANLLGRIVEIDAEDSAFNLRTLTNNVVRCHFESELFPFIRNALLPDGAGPAVRVSGEAVLDRIDKVVRMEVTEAGYADEADEASDTLDFDGDAEGIPPQRTFRAIPRQSDPAAKVNRRIDELESLGPGWLDGEGEPPAQEVLAHLRQLALVLAAPTHPPVRIYPTPEGGVQLEWTNGTHEYSIEVHADLSAYVVQVDTATDDLRERLYKSLNEESLTNILLGGVTV